MFCRYTLLGGRRGSDEPNTFSDFHGPSILAMALGIVALNVLDAVFTLLFLTHGGKELNPIVDRVLGFGPLPFLVLKSLGVGICTGFLVLTRNFRMARIGMVVTLLGYAALLAWHFHLLDLFQAGTAHAAG